MRADSRNWIDSSLYGIARGISVHSLIYPLEVVKIQQQCGSGSEKATSVARSLFQTKGIAAFYQGLTPQLVKTSIKQAWVWPMMTGVPSYLKRHGMGETAEQICTGLSIAVVDAAITTPLERCKMRSAFTGQGQLSLQGIYKDGWQGLTTHFAKLSVNWVTFLVAQKHLRNAYGTERLSLPQLAGVGVQVAVIVTLVSAPLDIANTLKQAKNESALQLFCKEGVGRLYRGSPLNALALVIHNVASVIVLDMLD